MTINALIGTYKGDKEIGKVIPKLAEAGINCSILTVLDDNGWQIDDVLDVTQKPSGELHLSIETRFFYIESK